MFTTLILQDHKMSAHSNTTFQNRRPGQEYQERPQHTPEEMLEFVINKIRNAPFVNLNSWAVEKNGRKWYNIKVKNNDLGRIGSGVFHSGTFDTISSDHRIVHIRLVFADDEHRNADILANKDTIIELFREVAKPKEGTQFTRPTIESIKIETYEDQKQNKHLAVFADTIKGASLIYTYNLCIEFVRRVNEKFGGDANTPSRQGRGKAAMTPEDIERKRQQLQQQLAELELQQVNQGQQPAAAADDTTTPQEPATTPTTPSNEGQQMDSPKKKPYKSGQKFVKVMVGNRTVAKMRSPSPQVQQPQTESK